MQYKFTKRAEKALQIADNLAIQFGHQYIGTEHLLIAKTHPRHRPSHLCVGNDILPDIPGHISKIEAPMDAVFDANALTFKAALRKAVDHGVDLCHLIGGGDISRHFILIV